MTEEGDRRLGLMDLLLYIPVGMLSELRSLLPRLAAEGRAKLDLRVLTARSLGQVTVTQARRRAPEVVSELKQRGESALAANDEPTTARVTKVPEPPAPEDERPADAEDEGPPAPTAASLPVPQYDALSALQVVPRLDGLDAEQLDLIEQYERAHRGRRTILHRIEQLREDPEGAPDGLSVVPDHPGH